MVKRESKGLAIYFANMEKTLIKRQPCVFHSTNTAQCLMDVLRWQFNRGHEKILAFFLRLKMCSYKTIFRKSIL